MSRAEDRELVETSEKLVSVVLLYDLEYSFMVKGVQPSICSCHTHDRE